MKIEWEQTCLPDLYDITASAAQLSLAADCCCVAESVPLPCAIHVLLVDDAYIRRINREQRGVDNATDVLSFPTVAYSGGKTARGSIHALRREWDPEWGACFLGDILISVEHARAQAQAYGHTVRRELCYLLTHGIFHLFGYDHMESEDQKEMRTMEEKALQMAGITRDEPALTTPTDDQLLALAREVMQRSYSPYSHFKVGACLLCEDGRVYQGCNVENASFGLTNCAERTAVFKAVSDGARSFSAIAIAAEHAAPWPCGACRQVLNEFAPGIRVLITWDNGKTAQATLDTLLPHGFGPKELP